MLSISSKNFQMFRTIHLVYNFTKIQILTFKSNSVYQLVTLYVTMERLLALYVVHSK